MAVAPVHELVLPGGYDDLVHGELALSVASPIDSAAPRATFYLSRWFDLQGGVYTLRSLTVGSALWMVSVSNGTGRIIQNIKPDLGVLTTTVYLPAGRQRIDIILTNPESIAGECFIAFSLFQDNQLVYTSSGSGWVFDATSIPDASLPVIGDWRRTLRLFSLTPNWSNGVVERIEWITEVLGSESDTEQRRSLRRYPRRSFEASFLRRDMRRARLSNFLFGSGNDRVLVPLWHEQFKLTETLGVSVEFPPGSLAMREYHEGDLVLVSNGDPAQTETLEIDTVDIPNDTIAFVDAPVATWAAGSRITPLRVGRVLDVAQMDDLTDRVGGVQIRFSLSDTEQWPDPSWGYCAPLFRFPVDRATPIASSFERPTANIVDGGAGPVEVTDIYQRERVGVRYSVKFFGRSSLVNFRAFVAMARGRAVRFWMPSLTYDLRPIGDIGGDYIDCVDAGFGEYVRRSQDARAMVAFVFADDRPAIYRRVDYVSDFGGVERVFFTVPVPPIQANDIERMMFVLPARFDQDGFEIQHHVDDSAVAGTIVVIRTSSIDGLPDIECFTTSKPYPVQAIEEMSIGVAVIGASLTVAFALDAMDISMDVVGGVFDDPGFIQYAMTDEALDVTAAVLGGVFFDPDIKSSLMAPEGIDVSVTVVDGVFFNPDILSTVMLDEALDISVAVIQGTLT